ncbi:hypothetical protein THAOC_22241, partial [Thalassiosira oceanica]
MWPDETLPQAAPPQHPRDGGATELSASPTRSFSPRCGDADAILPRLGATPTSAR